MRLRPASTGWLLKGLPIGLAAAPFAACSVGRHWLEAVLAKGQQVDCKVDSVG